MNTEFPSRVPTVSNTSVSTTSDSEFKKKTTDMLSKAIKALDNLTDKVTEFLSKNVVRSTSSATSTKVTKDDSTKISLFSSAVNSLKALTNKVTNFFSREERDSEEEKTENTRFRKRVNQAFGYIKGKWTKGIESLQSTIESTSMTIGNAVGGVFGSGIFGNMISKVITKALNFAVSKVLVGIGLKYLPIVGLLFAIYSIFKAWGSNIFEGISDFGESVGKAIWEAIKWLGNVIDQGIDYLVSMLPFTKSKYEEARKGLAEAAGVTEKDVLDYYGDTIEGRSKALDAWRLAQKSPEYLEALAEDIRKTTQDFGRHMSITAESAQYGSPSILEDILHATGNEIKEVPLSTRPEDLELSANPALNVSPVVNTMNNNTNLSLTSFGNNVSFANPLSPLPGYNSDAYIGGMSTIPAGFYN